MCKYFVHVDDGQEVYKIPIVVAVRDVAEGYQIESGRVRRALFDVGFSDCEVAWMVRTLIDYSVIA